MGYTHYKIKVLRNSTTLIFSTDDMQRATARGVFALLEHKFPKIDGYALSDIGVTTRTSASINNDDLTRGE